MKFLFALLIILLPLSASASILLADCDADPHDVIVKNSGSMRVVHMTEQGGELEEFGPYPMITFQIKEKGREHPEVHMLSPDEEFCIWKDEIKIQRLHTTNGFGGPGGGWR